MIAWPSTASVIRACRQVLFCRAALSLRQPPEALGSLQPIRPALAERHEVIKLRVPLDKLPAPVLAAIDVGIKARADDALAIPGYAHLDGAGALRVIAVQLDDVVVDARQGHPLFQSGIELMPRLGVALRPAWISITTNDYTKPWITAPRAKSSRSNAVYQASAREKNRWCQSRVRGRITVIASTSKTSLWETASVI